MKMKLPIDTDNFEKVRRENFYYVDKTFMIKNLLDNWGKVNLFIRPRRFGKSLNMSMLKNFFEIGCDKTLFDGLAISKEKELCDKYMCQFPVIYISLKAVNGSDFNTARSKLCTLIGIEALRFHFLLNSDHLTVHEKQMYKNIINVNQDDYSNFNMSNEILTNSLKILSNLLHKHYNKQVIILIDEYDVPLDKAKESKYYDSMVTLIRNMFDAVLKTNESLYFAVLTGCLRVAKESIFTGLNNPKIYSITKVRFDEYFGFTDDEVKDLLHYYRLEDKYDLIKQWYDGYHFGNTDVYCPWDVINCIDDMIDDRDIEPIDYWSHSSGNTIVRNFLKGADKGISKEEIEELISGKSVTKVIYEELTYDELYDNTDNLWSILFTTGYLTHRGKVDRKKYKLVIPNMEIKELFVEEIMSLFNEYVREDGDTLNSICTALEKGDAQEVERYFNEYLENTISLRDTYVRKDKKENYYQGIMMGILGYKAGWSVKSNSESGEGYPDIIIRISNKQIVIEFKYVENAKMLSSCKEAMTQIEEKHYTDALKDNTHSIIYKYAISCYKKKCKVLVKKEVIILED